MAFWTGCDIAFATGGGLQNWFFIYVFSIAVGAGAGSVAMMLITTVLVWIDLIQRTSKLSAKQSKTMRRSKLVLKAQVALRVFIRASRLADQQPQRRSRGG